MPEITRNRKLIAAVLIAVALVLLKVLCIQPEKAPESSRGKMKQPVSVTVEVAHVAPLSDRAVVSGTLVADQAVELKAEAAGRITRIAFREGAAVKKGELLAKINDAELAAQLSRARATLAQATDRAARQKTLLGKEAISLEEYESAIKEFETARADTALFAAQIRRTEVRAPFNGIVGLRSVDEGAFVSPGTKVTDVVSAVPLKLDFPVPERYYRKFTSGTRVRFTVQGSEKVYTARVIALDPRIDPSTRTANVRAVCLDPDRALAPGFFAKVEIDLTMNLAALTVPTQALVPGLEGPKLFLVRGGKAAPSPVSTGVRTGDRVEILTGLAEGDSVIVSGVQVVRPGSVVRISKED